MIFIITKASDWNFKEEKTINTLEELLEFQKQQSIPLVIKDDSITIYDDYME